MACMPRKSGIFGGTYSGGIDWDDRDPDPSPGIVGIHEIDIRHGDQVDAIQVTYRLANGSTYTAPMHGGTGGGLSSFTFASDEGIVRIEGKTNNGVVDQLTFITWNSTMDEKRYGPYGITGLTHFSFDGYIVGFFGRAGYLLDGLGVYYLPPMTSLFFIINSA